MPNFSPLTLCISATSFAISQFLFHVGSCRLSTRFTCGFTKLNAKQKIEWNSRTVSTIHAAVVGCFCLYILVYDDAVNKDPVWGNPFMVKLNVAITSGYLISGKWSRDDMDKPLRGHSCCLYNFRDYLPQYHWNPMNHTVAKGLCWAFLVLILWQIQHKLLLSSYDMNDGNEEYGCEQSRICAIKCHGTADEDLLLIICYWKAIGDKYFVTHHVAALYAYYYVLGEGMLPYFGNFRLLAEFSTPFVNQRWFFEVLGYPKHSLPNMVNGVLMTVVFFIVRIAVIPTYYTRVFSTFGTEAFHRLGLGAQCAWIISSVSLDIMNVMWMMKITKGCYKVLYHTDGVLTKTQKNGKAE